MTIKSRDEMREYFRREIASLGDYVGKLRSDPYHLYLDGEAQVQGAWDYARGGADALIGAAVVLGLMTQEEGKSIYEEAERAGLG